MKDIPIFDTEDGVSSLLLGEIPYRQAAYIVVQDVRRSGLEAHLAECVSFCRMVGGERIFVSGEGDFSRYPLVCAIDKMELRLHGPVEPTDRLCPVTAETVARWRELCNEKMAGVDIAATLTARDEKKILESGGGYFICDGETELGIGWLRGSEIAQIAALVPGMGERVVRTLCSACPVETVTLEVASTNARAIRLYKRLGFRKTGEVTRWYRLR